MNSTEAKSKGKEPQEKKDTGFSVKERLLLTVLLAFSAPLMLFVFGAIDVFGNNLAEFNFVLGDFILWNILFSLAASALIAAVLLPLRGRAFDFAFATIFWLSFMLFLQGNYLNFGLNSLSSDGTADITPGKIVLNTVIWLLVGAGIFFVAARLMKSRRELVKTVSTVALITVLGMQLLSLLTVALTTDAFMSYGDKVAADSENPEKNNVLTYENLGTVSGEGNIVYFVIDRFDYTYYEQALSECPEIFGELSGFTCFDDALSLYPRTYPSVAYMLTGVEQDFSMNRSEYFDYAYKNSAFLKTLSENGYDVNIYTDTYYGYESAASMSEYISNSAVENSEYSIVDAPGLGFKLAEVSMFRYFPFLFKSAITVGTGEFASHVKYDSVSPRYTTDMRDLYLHLTAQDMTKENGRKNFSFIHFSGTHTPYIYDEDFNELSAGESTTTIGALKQSFKIINRYISEMKRLGVYEEATIIITGDHGNIRSDVDVPKAPQTIPILFKASGSSEGELETSSAPVNHANLFAAVLDSEGVAHEGFAPSLFEIGEDETVERKYYFQRLYTVDGKRQYEQVEYTIVGSARDYENWVISERYDLEKSIYD